MITTMTIEAGQAASSFARYFYDKVQENVRKTRVDVNNVDNGKCKLIVQNINFMTKTDVEDCFSDLKLKRVFIAITWTTLVQ